MSPNRTYPPLTGAAHTPTDRGFARRRINDLAGLAAILSTALVVAVVTGVNTPAFAVVLLAALGALVFGEQRLRGAAPQHSVHRGAMTGRHVRA